jgi:hypothetical protein
MTYSIIFWGNLPYSIKLFRMQKKVIRIMKGLKKRDSFQEMQILPLCSQYVYSLMQYVVNNRRLFISNSEIHSIDTRQVNNLFPPSISITKGKKGAYYSSAIRIFNHLPMELKELTNDQRVFKAALKRFLHANSFYSLEKYFNYQCKYIN